MRVDTIFPSSSHSPVDRLSSYVWPSHLAVFDELLDTSCAKRNESIGQQLERLGYVEKARFWNGDVRRSLDTLLLEHSSLRVPTSA